MICPVGVAVVRRKGERHSRVGFLSRVGDRDWRRAGDSACGANRRRGICLYRRVLGLHGDEGVHDPAGVVARRRRACRAGRHHYVHRKDLQGEVMVSD